MQRDKMGLHQKLEDIELQSFIHEMITSCTGLTESDPQHAEVYVSLSNYLAGNRFFGIVPYLKDDGKIYIPRKGFNDFFPKIIVYLRLYGKSEAEKSSFLLSRFREFMPNAFVSIQDYIVERALPESTIFHFLDFLYEKLNRRDITDLSDDDLQEIVEALYAEQPKYIGDEIVFYFSWLMEQRTTYTSYKNGMYTTFSKPKYKLKYQKNYIMQNRVDTSSRTTAYSESEYLNLVYHLINEEYSQKNNMYIKAAESKAYVDTWLYLSLHFICALRDTDLSLIYHPKLNYKPEEVIQMVKDGTYTSDMAKAISAELMHWMYYLGYAPHKTERFSDVPKVKFFIPASLEEHFGILFSLAEAYHQLAGLSDEDPLIRRITTHAEIERNMGEEIGSMFLEEDFSARKANKSYLQSIEMFADPILANQGIEGTKAYMIASLARSHKGGYGNFAKTTAVYLRDANFSGLSADFVAKELFERGVLSSIVSMLLQIITGGEFNVYSVRSQTNLIQSMNLRPSEVESLIGVSEAAIQRSRKVVDEIMTIDPQNQNEMITNILHKLAIGDAPSKVEGIMCIMMAITGKCPFRNRDCYGCEYDVATKAAGYHVMSEYRRIRRLYNNTNDPLEKEQLSFLLTKRLLPFLQHLLQEMRAQYGPEYVAEFEKIITQNKD